MRFIPVLLLLICTTSFAQPWKSFIISVKGDTLNRVDMQGKKQGPWVISMPELRGEQGYDEQGYFMDDQKDGLWTRFSLMGDKIAEEHFRFGRKDGQARYYTRNGGLIRQESWRAVDPTKLYDTVDRVDINDPTRVVEKVVVKLEGQTNKHGLWTYYDPTRGTILKEERYFIDKLQVGDAGGSEDEDGIIRPIDVSASKTKLDSNGKKIITKPQAILDYEKKNSGKKKVKTRTGSTGM